MESCFCYTFIGYR